MLSHLKFNKYYIPINEYVRVSPSSSEDDKAVPNVTVVPLASSSLTLAM